MLLRGLSEGLGVGVGAAEATFVVFPTLYFLWSGQLGYPLPLGKSSYLLSVLTLPLLSLDRNQDSGDAGS